MPQNEVQDYLRRRLIADLHLGRLKPGDRAPSLRVVSSQLGVGIRAVSRAYSLLAEEKLVTIRGRSGVYVALPESVEPELTEPQSWYAAVLTDAWRRRIPLPMLPELLNRYVSRRMRCACIESTEDHMVAFCAELDQDFGLDTVGVRAGEEHEPSKAILAEVRDAIADTDFVVTTAFHAAEVVPAAREQKKPVVIVSVNESLVEAIQKKLSIQPVVMLAADGRFIHRVQRYLVDAFAAHGRLNVMLVDDYLGDPSPAGGAEPLLTRAARMKLDQAPTHLLDEPVPFLSLTAAREITQCMIAVHEQVPRLLQPA